MWTTLIKLAQANQMGFLYYMYSINVFKIWRAEVVHISARPSINIAHGYINIHTYTINFSDGFFPSVGLLKSSGTQIIMTICKLTRTATMLRNRCYALQELF